MSSDSDVIRTCELVSLSASHVSINDQAIHSWVASMTAEDAHHLISPRAFDHDLHYVDATALTAQYLLVVDSLNFCFWPTNGLEYEHLSKGLKARVEADPSVISAERLSSITPEEVSSFFLSPSAGSPESTLNQTPLVPMVEERARLLREVGQVLIESFEGQVANMITSAGGSARKLLRIITSSFPGFRDHTIFKGRQIFLYKRAQIFIADLYGAYGGKGLGSFSDVSNITMFADYRVPVVLRKLGILAYDSLLSEKVDQMIEIMSGSEEEVEIRALTVIAVERMKKALIAKHHVINGHLLSLHIDWHLWGVGEVTREQDVHHRCLTIYY